MKQVVFKPLFPHNPCDYFKFKASIRMTIGAALFLQKVGFCTLALSMFNGILFQISKYF